MEQMQSLPAQLALRTLEGGISERCLIQGRWLRVGDRDTVKERKEDEWRRGRRCCFAARCRGEWMSDACLGQRMVIHR